VLFDRSWANRAGVERIAAPTRRWDEFYRSVLVRRMLVLGIHLLKYWLSSRRGQYLRSSACDHSQRSSRPWMESRRRWRTAKPRKSSRGSHIPSALVVVQAVDSSARAHCIDHLLKQFPCGNPSSVISERERHEHYSRQAVPGDMLVPEIY
jgi:polyphosphate kinase 2 (PPK2 family)